MPILYESVFQTKKIRPKSTSTRIYQEQSAPYWHIVEVYKVGSIYMTAAQLRSNMKKALDNATAQKGLKVISYTVLKEWAIWQGLYTDYYIRYDAIVGSASTLSFQPIPIGTIIIVLAIVVGLVIILYIVLVGRETLQALFNLVPSSLQPAIATILLVGLGALAIGGGAYLLISVIPRKHEG
jgi:hypothetical protein